MLRNAYLESYKKDKKKLSEYEKDMLIHDGNHILQQERPLSNIGIKKLPNEMLSSFVNDIMCNKKTGHLLYPLTFPKQVRLYLKQQNYVYKITNLNKNKSFVDYLKEIDKKKNKEDDKNNLDNNNSNDSENENLLSCGKIINYQKQEEVDDIKKNIKSFKLNKSTKMKKLKIKNKKFFKSQPLVDKKLTKLSFRPVNDIRIKGYQKALDNCLQRSYINQNFNLPNIELNEDNVFSRLYNNVIVKNKTRNKLFDKLEDEDFLNIKQRKKKKGKVRFARSITPSHKFKTNLSSIKKINNNQKTISQDKHNPIQRGKKELMFHISNINKSLNGREFTQRITSKMYERCLSSLSGGPKFYLKRSKSSYIGKHQKSKSNKNKKKYINYYAKLTTKNCFLKSKSNPEITNNLNNKSADYLDTESINRLILANSNSRSEIINVNRFRDTNYNTNLHMAVLKNNYKFVYYFIQKKLNINKKNKNGDTPLHLAIQIGNYDIIKLLLDYGANIKIKNKRGVTPFDLADKEMRVIFNLEDMFNK